MIRLILIVLMLFVVMGSHAQTTKFSGVVIDQESSKPISYATIIYNNGKASVLTNEEGYFVIQQAKTPQVTIKSFGYESQKIELSDVKNSIPLAPAPEELQGVVVRKDSLTATKIVQHAFRKQKSNYSNGKVRYNTFYRHYCKEDSAYGRLIEAAVDLYDSKGHNQISYTPSERIGVQVNQIRRSYDFTKNFSKHDPISLYSTLKHDLTAYWSPHHGAPAQNNYYIKDTVFYDGGLVWVIGYSFFQMKEGKKPFQTEVKGELYINVNDFAFLKVKEEQASVLEEEYQDHSYRLNWEVRYAKYEETYHLIYAMESGYNKDDYQNNEHQVINTLDHFFHVELMVNGVQTHKPKAIKTKEPSAQDLSNIVYDEKFWQQYTVLQDAPINEVVLEDLERQKTLKEQFQDQN